MSEEELVKEKADDMFDTIKDAIEKEADQIMNDIKGNLIETTTKWQDKAKEFIASRFTNLLSIVTSRKNIIATLAILFIGPAHYKAIFAIAALAMILNTVEKCAYIIKEPKIAGKITAAVDKVLDKK